MQVPQPGISVSVVQYLECFNPMPDTFIGCIFTSNPYLIPSAPRPIDLVGGWRSTLSAEIFHTTLEEPQICDILEGYTQVSVFWTIRAHEAGLCSICFQAWKSHPCNALSSLFNLIIFYQILTKALWYLIVKLQGDWKFSAFTRLRVALNRCSI